jgi:hypothetical protein
MNLVQTALLRRRELEGQLVEKIAQQLACADLFALFRPDSITRRFRRATRSW